MISLVVVRGLPRNVTPKGAFSEPAVRVHVDLLRHTARFCNQRRAVLGGGSGKSIKSNHWELPAALLKGEQPNCEIAIDHVQRLFGGCSPKQATTFAQCL